MTSQPTILAILWAKLVFPDPLGPPATITEEKVQCSLVNETT